MDTIVWKQGEDEFYRTLTRFKPTAKSRSCSLQNDPLTSSCCPLKSRFCQPPPPWNFQWPSVGEIWIFSRTSHFINKHLRKFLRYYMWESCRETSLSYLFGSPKVLLLRSLRLNNGITKINFYFFRVWSSFLITFAEGHTWQISPVTYHAGIHGETELQFWAKLWYGRW